MTEERAKLLLSLAEIGAKVERMTDKEVSDMIIFFEGWKAREKFEEKKGA